MAGSTHPAAPGREYAVIAVADALAHVAAVLAGGACIAVFFRSIVIAVFLQRPRYDAVARISAAITGAVFDTVLPRSAPQARVDRVLVWFWPFAQFVMIYAWYTLVTAGFAAVYWGTGASPDAVQALIASGSSLSTLGFATPSNHRGEVIAIIEGGIGLFIVVFLVTFIPTYLAAQQARADRVARVYARAGAPPTGTGLVAWYCRAGRREALDDLCAEWESWIRDLGVTHSQSPGLAVTRSYRHGENWVSAVMAMLDAAAIAKDVTDDPAPTATVLLVAAKQSLSDLADALRAAPVSAPLPSRSAFDAACREMEAAGARLKADRDAAWLAFLTSQERYADLLVGLAAAIRVGPETWRLTGR